MVDPQRPGGTSPWIPNLSSLRIVESSQMPFQGQGGNISLIADVVLIDPFSQIDASAGPAGIDGSVNIQAPIQNLSGTIAPLPQSLLQIAEVYASRCVAQKGGKFSSFVSGGTDGIPGSPGGFLLSPLDISNIGFCSFDNYYSNENIPISSSSSICTTSRNRPFDETTFLTPANPGTRL